MTRLRAGVFVGVVAIAAALGWAAPQYADEIGEKVYQRTLLSVVWVLPEYGSELKTSASGSLIDRTRGLILTNYHVVADTDKVIVFFPVFQNGLKNKPRAERTFYLDQVRDAGCIPGKVIARDPKRDLALIEIAKVPEGFQELKLARDGVSPGQRVHSVGNPGRSGALWVYTSGTVRQTYHKKWKAKSGPTVYDFEADVVETQSPTNEGDSGGPLLNDQGELVAVTQGMANDAQLLTIFIDVGEVKAMLKANKIAPKVAAAKPSKGPELKVQADKAPAVLTEDEKAARLLSLAKTLADEGKKDKARTRFEEILKQYPMTEAAKEAKVLLDKLNSK